MKIAVLLSRVRIEEKLLLQAFEARGLPVEVVADREIVFDLHRITWSQYDVVVERCVTQSRALYALRILNDWGVHTQLIRVEWCRCGDKLETSSALVRAGLPSPRCKVAFTPESALVAIEEMGYPVILKPRTHCPPGCKRSSHKAAQAGRGTHRRWVKAYSRYAATSARASGVPIQRMGHRR